MIGLIDKKGNITIHAGDSTRTLCGRVPFTDWQHAREEFGDRVQCRSCLRILARKEKKKDR